MKDNFWKKVSSKVNGQNPEEIVYKVGLAKAEKDFEAIFPLSVKAGRHIDVKFQERLEDNLKFYKDKKIALGFAEGYKKGWENARTKYLKVLA
jgi:hypothetical protein